MSSYRPTSGAQGLVSQRKDYTFIEPTKFSKMVVHPFNQDRLDQVYDPAGTFADVLYLTWPRIIMKDTVKSFTQFNTTVHSNMSAMTNLLLQVFGFIVNKPPKTNVSEAYPSVVCSYYVGFRPHEVDLVIDDNGNEVEADEKSQEDRMMEECDRRDIVCFTVQAVIQTRNYCAGALIDELITSNERAMKNSLNKGKNPNLSVDNVNKFDYKYMTRDSYLTACVAYTCNPSILKDPKISLPLWDAHNPINPIRVFTLENSMRYRQRLGCVLQLCDPSLYCQIVPEQYKSITVPDVAYFEENGCSEEDDKIEISDPWNDGGEHDDRFDGMSQAGDEDGGRKKKKKKGGKKREIKIMRNMYRFSNPFGGWNAYRISPDQLAPYNLSAFHLPHIRKPHQHNNKELAVYMMQHGADESDEHGMVIESVYGACVNTDNTIVEKNDIRNLAKRMQERFAKIPAKFAKNPEKYNIYVEHYTKIGLREFETVYNMDGAISPSEKAVLAWGDEYLQTHANFGWYLPKKNCNISRFGNLLIHLNVTLDTIFGVSHLNTEVLCGWTANMHKYSDTLFHTHIIFSGEHSGGKSYISDLLMLLNIPKTITESAYKSKMAMNVDGDTYNHRAEFYPEMPPHMLDVQDGPKGSKVQESASLEVAMFKMRLTCGRLITQVKQQNADGKWEQVESESLCNSQVTGCVNIVKSRIPASVASRFLIIEVVNGSPRKDGMGPIEKTVRSSNPYVEVVKNRLVTRQRCTEYIIAMMSALTNAHILPAVSLNGVIPILLETLRRGQKAGLEDTSLVRHMERVLILATTNTHINVKDLLWDSELRIFQKDQKFKIEHLMATKPFLFATQETLFVAFGYASTQFEDPNTLRILQACHRYFSRNTRPKMSMPPPPDPEKNRKTASNITIENGEILLDGKRLVPSTISKLVNQSTEKDSSAAASSRSEPTPPHYVAGVGWIDSDELNREHQQQQQQQTSSEVPVTPTTISPIYYSIVEYGIKNSAMSAYSEPYMRAILADDLIRDMNPAPSKQMAMSVLWKLARKSVVIKEATKTEKEVRIPMLQFQYGKHAFAWAQMDQLILEDQLARIFMDVISYPNAPKQVFVYPRGSPETPQLPKTFVNNPSPNNPPVRMYNPDYFDKTLISYTQSLASGSDADREGQFNEFVDWNQVFSNTASIVFDGDADEYAAITHCKAHLIPLSKIKELGIPLTPREQRDQCNAILRKKGKELPPYPQVVKEMICGKQKRDRDQDVVYSSSVVDAYKKIMNASYEHQMKRQQIRKPRRSPSEVDVTGRSSAELLSDGSSNSSDSPFPYDEDMFLCDDDLKKAPQEPIRKKPRLPSHAAASSSIPLAPIEESVDMEISQGGEDEEDHVVTPRVGMSVGISKPTLQKKSRRQPDIAEGLSGLLLSEDMADSQDEESKAYQFGHPSDDQETTHELTTLMTDPMFIMRAISEQSDGEDEDQSEQMPSLDRN